MCAAAPKKPALKGPEVAAPNLTLLDEDSPGKTRDKLRRGRAQVTNKGTGLAIPSAGSGGGPSTGLAIPTK